MEIHERLKFLRKQEQKTQSEVSAAINKSRSTYQAYESGKIKPNVYILWDIANYYKISLDYLCGRLDDKDPLYIPLRYRGITNKMKELDKEELGKFVSLLDEFANENDKEQN